MSYLFYSFAGFITLPINSTEPEGKEENRNRLVFVLLITDNKIKMNVLWDSGG